MCRSSCFDIVDALSNVAIVVDYDTGKGLYFNTHARTFYQQFINKSNEKFEVPIFDYILSHCTDISLRTSFMMQLQYAGYSSILIPLMDPMTMDTKRIEIVATLIKSKRSWMDIFSKKKLALLVQRDVTRHFNENLQTRETNVMQTTLLLNIYPRHVLDFLLNQDIPELSTMDSNVYFNRVNTLNRVHRNIGCMYISISGLQSLAQAHGSVWVLNKVRNIHNKLDDLCTKHHLYKIDAVSKYYIVTTGVLCRESDGSSTVDMNPVTPSGFANMFIFARMAMGLAEAAGITLQIGFNIGDCISGLIGLHIPKFVLMGNTIHICRMMQIKCRPGNIRMNKIIYDTIKRYNPTLIKKGTVIRQQPIHVPLETERQLSDEDISDISLESVSRLSVDMEKVEMVEINMRSSMDHTSTSADPHREHSSVDFSEHA